MLVRLCVWFVCVFGSFVCLVGWLVGCCFVAVFGLLLVAVVFFPRPNMAVPVEINET